MRNTTANAIRNTNTTTNVKLAAELPYKNISLPHCCKYNKKTRKYNRIQ